MRKKHIGRFTKPDVGIEDHGFFIMHGHFDYDEGASQGLGYGIDTEFIRRFIRAFGVYDLSACSGKILWVEHSHAKIYKLIPFTFDEDAEEFDIEAWCKECEDKNKEDENVKRPRA